MGYGVDLDGSFELDGKVDNELAKSIRVLYADGGEAEIVLPEQIRKKMQGCKDEIPSCWCPWTVSNDGKRLEATECGEDMNHNYYYLEWLYFLLRYFFTPHGVLVNGDVLWDGSDSANDKGVISVRSNVVQVKKYCGRDLDMEDEGTWDSVDWDDFKVFIPDCLKEWAKRRHPGSEVGLCYVRHLWYPGIPKVKWGRGEWRVFSEMLNASEDFVCEFVKNIGEVSPFGGQWYGDASAVLKALNYSSRAFLYVEDGDTAAEVVAGAPYILECPEVREHFAEIISKGEYDGYIEDVACYKGDDVNPWAYVLIAAPQLRQYCAVFNKFSGWSQCALLSVRPEFKDLFNLEELANPKSHCWNIKLSPEQQSIMDNLERFRTTVIGYPEDYEFDSAWKMLIKAQPTFEKMVRRH